MKLITTLLVTAICGLLLASCGSTSEPAMKDTVVYDPIETDVTDDEDGDEDEDEMDDEEMDDKEMMDDKDEEEVDDEMMDDDVAMSETFEVSGTNFAFSETEISVKKGTTVTINFVSEDGFHDWVVDEFDAATEKVETGGTTSVTFVADEAGSFEYYCSVGQHRANGMVGTLTVTE